MNPHTWGRDSDDDGAAASVPATYLAYVGYDDDDYPNGQPNPDEDDDGISDNSSNDDQPTYHMVKMAQTLNAVQSTPGEVDDQGHYDDDDDDDDDDYPNGQPDPDDSDGDGDTIATELVGDDDDDDDTIVTQLVENYDHMIIEATPNAYDTDGDGDTIATELVGDDDHVIIEATPNAYDTDGDSGVSGDVVPPRPFPRQTGEPVSIRVPFVHRDVAAARFGEPPADVYAEGTPNILLDMLHCSQFFAQGDRRVEYIAEPLVKVFMWLMLGEVCAGSVDHEVVYRLRHDVARLCEQKERAVIMDESDPMKWFDLITFTDVPVDHNKYEVLHQWVSENVPRGTPLLDVYLKMLEWRRTGAVTQLAN